MKVLKIAIKDNVDENNLLTFNLHQSGTSKQKILGKQSILKTHLINVFKV